MLAGRFLVSGQLPHPRLRVTGAHQRLPDQDRIDPDPLQLVELLAALVSAFGDDRLPGRNVGDQLMRGLDGHAEVAKVAVGAALNGRVEVAGPDQFRLDDIVRRYLASRHDPRSVIADPNAHYYGAKLGERTLVPENNATIGETSFDDWLSRQLVSATA